MATKTTRKATAKKTPAKAASKTAAKKAPARKAAPKKVAAKKAPTKAAPRKATKRASDDKYTNPALRERLKKKIMAGDKGGDPGQWSARKAQLLVQEYKKAGGGFKGGPDETQKHLKQWTKEDWHTADKKQARRPGGTARYLPDKAWDKLSAAERRSTDKKKREGSQKGKQFVANTAAARKARKRAT